MSFAVVVSDIAPLYTKPEPLCELADEALYGMVVEVLAREGMYCRVRTHYRYEGWTPARCLLEDGAPAARLDTRRTVVRLRVVPHGIRARPRHGRSVVGDDAPAAQILKH